MWDLSAIPGLINLNRSSFTSQFVFLRSIFGICDIKIYFFKHTVRVLFNKQKFLFSVGGWKAFENLVVRSLSWVIN